MIRLLSILVLVLVAVPCLGAEGSSSGGLAYTPPAAPLPPDLGNLVFRLIGLTAALLVLCVGIVWFARRANRFAVAGANSAGRMRHEGTLALDRRSAVHLVWVDGQTVAVTTDATGLRSIVVLSEPFDKVLDDAANREAA